MIDDGKFNGNPPNNIFVLLLALSLLHHFPPLRVPLQILNNFLKCTLEENNTTLICILISQITPFFTLTLVCTCCEKFTPPPKKKIIIL